jgi:4-aminobutyrate aminotransferase
MNQYCGETSHRDRKPETRSAQLLATDQQYVAESMKIRFFPIVLESSTGCRIRDVDGREYLDFSSSWAVANTGYGHPRVVAAACDQLRKTSTNSHLSIPSAVTITLAERLAQLLPGDFAKKVWFGHSGSEAGDLISKFVPIARRRPRMLSFVGGYHGATAGAARLAGHASLSAFSDDPRFAKVPYPNPFRYPGTPDECSREHLEGVRRTLEADPESYAGVVVEPLMSDGGLIVPPVGFLEGLERLCRAYGCYLIADEVKSGFGRTGRLFAFEHSSLIPDAVMLGKPMASGIPLSAVVGRSEILDAVPSGHMLSTGGNPVACAAGMATLDVILEEHLVELAAERGEQLRTRLAQVAARCEAVGDVRGRGLMIGVELVVPGTKNPNASLAAQVCYRAAELGLVLFYVGMKSNVLEITPPLVVSANEIDQGVEILERALGDALAGRVSAEKTKAFAGW